MQPPNLDFKKRAWKWAFLAHQMQNFPSQSGVQTKFRFKKSASWSFF